VVKHKSSVASLLNSTGATQTANNQIEQLLAEIEQLKGDRQDKSALEQQVEKLREQLKERGGEHQVSVDSIVPNPSQPRQTFTEADIKDLARSLEYYGQLEPVILIPQKDGSNFIFDGERRWRAAKQNVWTDLSAVFIPPLDKKDLHRKALVTTLCRQDLNALDRAEAVLYEIEQETGVSPPEAVNLIRSCIFRLDRQKLTKKLTENLGKPKYDFTSLKINNLEASMMKVLLDLSLNPSSFVAHDLKALALPADIKAAIRSQGLQIKHSFTLSRLSARNLKVTEAAAKRTRKKAIAHVLGNELPTSETSAYVNSLLSKQGEFGKDSPNPKHKAILKSARKISEELNSPDLPLETLSVLEKEIKHILESIQERIAGRS
jgi:ParB family chromosome partitioning protein